MKRDTCPICGNSVRVGADERLSDHYVKRSGEPDLARLSGVTAKPCRGSGRRLDHASSSN